MIKKYRKLLIITIIMFTILIITKNTMAKGVASISGPSSVESGQSVTVTVNENIEYNGNKYPIASLPDNLVKIIDAGGLVKAMRKLNGLD